MEVSTRRKNWCIQDRKEYLRELFSSRRSDLKMNPSTHEGYSFSQKKFTLSSFCPPAETTTNSRSLIVVLFNSCFSFNDIKLQIDHICSILKSSTSTLSDVEHLLTQSHHLMPILTASAQMPHGEEFRIMWRFILELLEQVKKSHCHEQSLIKAYPNLQRLTVALLNPVLSDNCTDNYDWMSLSHLLQLTLSMNVLRYHLQHLGKLASDDEFRILGTFSEILDLKEGDVQLFAFLFAAAPTLVDKISGKLMAHCKFAKKVCEFAERFADDEKIISVWIDSLLNICTPYRKHFVSQLIQDDLPDALYLLLEKYAASSDNNEMNLSKRILALIHQILLFEDFEDHLLTPPLESLLADMWEQNSNNQFSLILSNIFKSYFDILTPRYLSIFISQNMSFFDHLTDRVASQRTTTKPLPSEVHHEHITMLNTIINLSKEVGYYGENLEHLASSHGYRGH